MTVKDLLQSCLWTHWTAFTLPVCLLSSSTILISWWQLIINKIRVKQTCYSITMTCHRSYFTVHQIRNTLWNCLIRMYTYRALSFKFAHHCIKESEHNVIVHNVSVIMICHRASASFQLTEVNNHRRYLWIIKGNWIACPKCDETSSTPWHNIRSAISTTRDMTCVHYRRCHLRRCCVLQLKRTGRIYNDSSSWKS